MEASAMSPTEVLPRWEHFEHMADIGRKGGEKKERS